MPPRQQAFIQPLGFVKFPPLQRLYTNNYSKHEILQPPLLMILVYLPHEIGQIIKSLKSKNSSGYDEISTRILKLSAPYILSPLTQICNRILSTGIFPDRLNKTNSKKGRG